MNSRSARTVFHKIWFMYPGLWSPRQAFDSSVFLLWSRSQYIFTDSNSLTLPKISFDSTALHKSQWAMVANGSFTGGITALALFSMA
uniref:Uncharacterized protein n=1 Tax=Timema bartmani TaxID=61472 RepID=A0A7R9F4H4_9NEOP|nr:unnamed protein product [Timema bartmani]